MEKPSIPHPIQERAAIHSDSFLMRAGNHTFLSGTRPYPIQADPRTGSAFAVLLITCVGLAIGVYLLGLLLGLLGRPLWLTSIILTLVLGSPLLLIGAILLSQKRYQHQRWEGQVILGRVVNAEKTRTFDSRGRKSEHIRVEYEFTDPLGLVVNSQQTTLASLASQDMAPPPQTTVYVGYVSTFTYFLL